MKALYPLILASGTKEALFAALWLALDEEPGTFADATFETIRDVAARFGVALTDSQVRKRVKELEALDVLGIAPRRERGRFDLYVYQPSPRRFPTPSPPKPEPATPLFDAAFGKGVEAFAPAAVPVFAAVSETETGTKSVAKTYATDVGIGRINVASPQTLQTPTFAGGRVVRPTSTIPAVASVAPEPEPQTVAASLEEINIKNKTINKPAKDFERLGEDVGDQRALDWRCKITTYN